VRGISPDYCYKLHVMTSAKVNGGHAKP